MVMRQFETGATRDTDTDKLDYEGFLCPKVLKRYAEYLHKHRKTASGIRNSDNWQHGIPLEVYMKSAWRHFHAVWMNHRGYTNEDITEELCALLFNVMGYLHEELKQESAPYYRIEAENLIDYAFRDELADGYGVPHG